MRWDWERLPVFMGRRVPARDEDLCVCSIPLLLELIALVQLPDLEIPAVFKKSGFAKLSIPTSGTHQKAPRQQGL